MESRKRGQKKMIECTGETRKFRERVVEMEKKRECVRYGENARDM